MSPDEPAPPGIDHATDARVFDWLAGGTDNYPPDNATGSAILHIAPSAGAVVRNSQAFARRATRALVRDCGVRRILDLGCGVPTQPYIHTVAQSSHPGTRVVHVDNDRLVLGQARMLLDQNEYTSVVAADISDVDALTRIPDIADLLDEGPVAVLATAVLNCLRCPATFMRDLVGRLPSGSYVVVSVLVSDRPDVRHAITDAMLAGTGGAWGRVATSDEAAALLSGLDVLPPGPGDVAAWRTDDIGPYRTGHQGGWEVHMYGGVARVPCSV
ncbi:SAM-dependent methyltransferase [Embleya sp. NPDC020630]|uniref:SAM-dependent methyltransferase n=1 Tax=Embleya sp. NPDC020630 TaxID=3363979 RepID=UPI0037ABC749